MTAVPIYTCALIPTPATHLTTTQTQETNVTCIVAVPFALHNCAHDGSRGHNGGPYLWTYTL